MDADERMRKALQEDPVLQQGWNAWLEGKVHNDNPYRDEDQARRWDAGLEMAAHSV